MPGGQSDISRNHAAFIWSVADLLRGDYKQSEYGKVILPMTVLRRLDCVLAPTKDAVLQRAVQLEGRVENIGPVLERVAGQQFYNTSRLDFARLIESPDDLAGQLRRYIGSFSWAPGTCSTSSTSARRSRASTARTCCTSSCRGSPASTCTRTGCRTSRWATPLRGARAALLGAIQRDGRRALHAS